MRYTGRFKTREGGRRRKESAKIGRGGGERSERFSKCNFSSDGEGDARNERRVSRREKKQTRKEEGKRNEKENSHLRSARARITYMQFILTKGASLSHCTKRRDRRRDRRRDLNILFRDSRRDNSDGGESRLGREEEGERGRGGGKEMAKRKRRCRRGRRYR